MRKQNLWSAALALLMPSLTAMANDGVYYTSGSMLIPIEETDIAINREVLSIVLDDSRYAKVVVDYEFYNPGERKTVRMGFEALPPSGDVMAFETFDEHPYIHDFTVEIDGKRLEYSNALADITGDKTRLLNNDEWKPVYDGMQIVRKDDEEQVLEEYAIVYYFDVTFQRGLNHVHHTYYYDYSMAIGTTFDVPYWLRPAGRWAGGTIGDFTLLVCVPQTAKHFFLDCADFAGHEPEVYQGMAKVRKASDTAYEASVRDGVLRVHIGNYHPDADLSITSADYLTSFSKSTPFAAFYDRSSESALMWYDYAHEMDDSDDEEFVIDEKLRRDVLRNLPYAHRGRVFKRKDLDAYFRSLWWYMPDPDYTDDTSDFTPVDWSCVRQGSNK